MQNLIKCQDCDGQVSLKAKVCPHCGKPDPSGEVARKWSKRINRIAFFFCAVIVVTALLVFIILGASFLLQMKYALGPPDKQVGTWLYYTHSQGAKTAALPLEGGAEGEILLTMTRTKNTPTFGFFFPDGHLPANERVILYDKEGGKVGEYIFSWLTENDVFLSADSGRTDSFLSTLRKNPFLEILIRGSRYFAENEEFAQAEKWVREAP